MIMGWFDAGIMGGDPPMDVLGSLSDIILVVADDYEEVDPNEYDTFMLYPIGNWDDKRAKLIAKSVRENWDKIEKLLEEYEKEDRKRDNIAIQVVATVIMASGAAFPRGFKEVARTAGRNDEWASRDECRKERIQEYIQAITDYKAGNRVVLTSTGLFEKMADML